MQDDEALKHLVRREVLRGSTYIRRRGWMGGEQEHDVDLPSRG